MVLRRGRKGFRFRYRYDAAGRCVFSAGEGEWYGVALTYDEAGRTTWCSGRWRGLDLSLPAAGKLSEVHDPLGGVEKFLYDGLGRATHEVDPLGNVTGFLLDAAGARVRKLLRRAGRGAAGSARPAGPARRAGGAQPGRVSFRAAAGTDGRRHADGRGTGRPRHPRPGARTGGAPAGARTRWRRARHRMWVKPLGVAWWPLPRRGRVFNALGKLVEQRTMRGGCGPGAMTARQSRDLPGFRRRHLAHRLRRLASAAQRGPRRSARPRAFAGRPMRNPPRCWTRAAR